MIKRIQNEFAMTIFICMHTNNTVTRCQFTDTTFSYFILITHVYYEPMLEQWLSISAIPISNVSRYNKNVKPYSEYNERWHFEQ